MYVHAGARAQLGALLDQLLQVFGHRAGVGGGAAAARAAAAGAIVTGAAGAVAVVAAGVAMIMLAARLAGLARLLTAAGADIQLGAHAARRRGGRGGRRRNRQRHCWRARSTGGRHHRNLPVGDGNRHWHAVAVESDRRLDVQRVAHQLVRHLDKLIGLMVVEETRKINK